MLSLCVSMFVADVLHEGVRLEVGHHARQGVAVRHLGSVWVLCRVCFVCVFQASRWKLRGSPTRLPGARRGRPCSRGGPGPGSARRPSRTFPFSGSPNSEPCEDVAILLVLCAVAKLCEALQKGGTGPAPPARAPAKLRREKHGCRRMRAESAWNPGSTAPMPLSRHTRTTWRNGLDSTSSWQRA